MAALIDDAAKYLKKNTGTDSRVLLINPPVQERRYNWLKWNQPLELLKLSGWLKKTHPGIDVRLFDFMAPDLAGGVAKHKVKERWAGAPDDAVMWHFGVPFEAFERQLGQWLVDEKWIPDAIVISSLTSYWHVSIEKLLIKVCTRLGQKVRRRTKLVLYGNYPRFEPQHAATQPDADVALTSGIPSRGVTPDFDLYVDGLGRPPNFYALDIEDDGIGYHLESCLAIEAANQKRRGSIRPPTITVAFFNDDVCGPKSRLDEVAAFASANPKKLVIEGIAGVVPRTLTTERLSQMKEAGFRSLFVEHATAAGKLDVDAYQPLRNMLREAAHAKRSGAPGGPWCVVTAFVNMGLPTDNMDELVRGTLLLNSYFQSIILKPMGYSPSLDPASELERRARWRAPYASSPQWFPYVGHGSRLAWNDYKNLVRWQNVLNKRVKGATFDFLDGGSVARLVRETLVMESWKRQMVAQ